MSDDVYSLNRRSREVAAPCGKYDKKPSAQREQVGIWSFFLERRSSELVRRAGRRWEMKLRLYESIARYLMGAYFLFGAIDGALGIFFNIYVTGESTDRSFHGVLQHTLYFWGFMKLTELIGAASSLLNYVPAFGVALLTPISEVLCVFYVFGLHWYSTFFGLAITNLILLRAYWPS